MKNHRQRRRSSISKRKKVMIFKWLPVASAAGGEVAGDEGGLLRRGCGWHIAVRNFLLKDQRYGQTRMLDINLNNNGNQKCM